MYEALALLAAFTVIYSAIAGRLERTWVSGAIVFTGFGLLVGPLGLDLLKMETDAESLRTLAEFTLALVLFTDAAGADLGVLRRVKALPIRLLGIGLPLTIVLGFVAGRLLFGEMTIFEVALVATMLAPTDAALGKAVVTNKAVPDSIRQGLNAESGLNDGICVPILFLFLALAQGQVSDQGPWHDGLILFLQAVGIGVAVGSVLTVATVWLLGFCRRHGWGSASWTRVTVIALAFSCFGLSQALGGSGFIASFTGGLLFGGLMKSHKAELLDEAEGVGDLFGLLTWVLFGAAVVGQAFEFITWQVVVYAVLSLTVARMLPVFLVVSGMRESTESKLFMGWFGPRGLASIVFSVIVFGAALPHSRIISATVVCTVVLSIVLHGVTANPWAKAFGAREAARARSSS